LFHQKAKILEDWISNAQLIVNEKNEDYEFLIDKHKVIKENFIRKISKFNLIIFRLFFAKLKMKSCLIF
jgi:hypothetical protein